MTLVAHVVWGASFSQLLGFSFLTLRISTMVAGCLGLVAFDGVLAQLGVNQRVRPWAVAALGFNPIYFQLSHTFMTDVPFLALLLGSVYFWSKWACGGRSTPALCLSVILMIVATLARQVGIAIGLGFAAATLFQLRAHRRSWLPAAIFLLAPILSYLIYSALAVLSEAQSQTLGQFQELLERTPTDIVKKLSKRIVWRGLASWVYLGAFALVVAAPGIRDLPRAARWRVALAGTVNCLILLASGRVLPHFGDALPHGNIIVASGLGPNTLAERGIGIYSLSEGVWTGLTIIGAFSGALLIELLLGWLRLVVWSPRLRTWKDAPAGAWLGSFFAVGGAVYITPFFLTWVFFDRYLLFLLVIALTICSHALQDRVRSGVNPQTIAQALILMAFAWYGITGTHDYLSWNRVRWEVLTEFMEETKTSAREITGGFEFDKWHQYRDPVYEDGDAARASWSLAYAPEPGFEVLGAYEYPRWMFCQPGQIYLLQRVPEN